jgi:UDP-N-acetylglucosamine 4,6-dehydratase/5-epimerase
MEEKFLDNLSSFYKGKEVLITGGCGSIGRELVRQLIKMGARIIKVLDNESHFELQQKTNAHSVIRHLLGDVRNKNRLDFAMHNVDIVFHAAALKHVPLCEYNPFEALETNVIGTQNVVDVARSHNVKQFVFISTDKAVNPINTMGATKLLGEKLTLNADLGHSITKFSCVRFGNVLGSSGSVLSIFKDQIKEGGPVTLTSPLMTRFCMSLHDAVSLILKVPPIMEGREIFILNMKALKVKDLAEVLISYHATKGTAPPGGVQIKEIGVRPGEKLHEVLVSPDEITSVRLKGDLFVVRAKTNVPHVQEQREISGEHHDANKFSSGHTTHLTKEELHDLLAQENLLD